MTGGLPPAVCYSKEPADGHAGFAGQPEIIAALNELLEAERAGARVARASSKRAADVRYRALMATVGKDEAHWCAMLSRHLERLGATPSRATGAFYAKAMAIEAPLDRLAFLNRGQAWVVRRLESLLPRIGDEYLQRELIGMLAGHRTNMDVATDYLHGARAEP